MLGVKAMIWHPRGRLPFSPDAGVGWHNASARATCVAHMRLDGHPSHHPAPDEDCNCGIHALYGMGFLMEYLILPDVAFYGRCRSRLFMAILEPSGKVIEHEYGWRAETATIVAVTSSADLASSLDSDARSAIRPRSWGCRSSGDLKSTGSLRTAMWRAGCRLASRQKRAYPGPTGLPLSDPPQADPAGVEKVKDAWPARMRENQWPVA